MNWLYLFVGIIALALLRENLFIYGLGGITAPFIGIKLIDLILLALGLT